MAGGHSHQHEPSPRPRAPLARPYELLLPKSGMRRGPTGRDCRIHVAYQRGACGRFPPTAVADALEPIMTAALTRLSSSNRYFFTVNTPWFDDARSLGRLRSAPALPRPPASATRYA